jgi:hypothetical protein
VNEESAGFKIGNAEMLWLDDVWNARVSPNLPRLWTDHLYGFAIPFSSVAPSMVCSCKLDGISDNYFIALPPGQHG